MGTIFYFDLVTAIATNLIDCLFYVAVSYFVQAAYYMRAYLYMLLIYAYIYICMHIAYAVIPENCVLGES